MNCLLGWAPFSPYLYFKTAGFLFVGEAGVEWKTKIQFPHAVSRGDSSHICLRPDFPGWGRQTATSRGKAVPCRRRANLGAARRPRTVQGNPAALPESSSSPGGRTKAHRNSLTFTADYRRGWQNPDWQTRARACSAAHPGLQPCGLMLPPPPAEDRLTRDASRDTSACCCPPAEAQILAGTVAALTGHSRAWAPAENRHEPRWLVPRPALARPRHGGYISAV